MDRLRAMELFLSISQTQSFSETARRFGVSATAVSRMITDIEDFFSKGCGRCDRFTTEACSARKWLPGLEGLRGWRGRGLGPCAGPHGSVASSLTR